MNFITYANIGLSVIGILAVIFALMKMPPARCTEPMVGDALVLVAYLLMINTYWIAQKTPQFEMAARGWHLFDLVVIVNILFHARQMAATRRARRRRHRQQQKPEGEA